MFRILLFFLFFSFLNAQDYQQYVNPFIGTDGHGHTFPGATLPHGMVQLSPDTRIDGSWDGCSGYHYSDDKIYGFSHIHLSGTGVSDYGDIMLMPTMDVDEIEPETYASKFNHKKEQASAGFYAVHLDKYNIDVELTTSYRVGFHRYTFNQEGNAKIILDLNHRDQLTARDIKIIDEKTIEVYRRSDAWARNQEIWARIEFNKPVIDLNNKDLQLKDAMSDLRKGFIFKTKVKKGEQLLVKVSLSFTGYEGAKLNSSEITDWDFERVKTEAKSIWNKELAVIEARDPDPKKLVNFYTALYHTKLQPNIAQDLDGKYMGRDFRVHKTTGFDYYTVFSLWDTFRAAHPLYTLIDQKRTIDYIKTFITQYEQGGRLPVWELASNETDCMIGYHSVSVIADAMLKGMKGFDYEKAFEAAKHSAMLNHLGLKAYKENGFIAIDDEHESVSKTLEYAYDDWCIAQMAKILNQPTDYQYYMRRAQNWKNLFDTDTKLMRPKKNGAWLTPFDGREVNNNYTEGNSWQYSFFVPQDIPGLIEFHGGKENFEANLDELFSLPSATTGREQVDITGLIGQYAHGNEPSHHVAYLYNFVGKPEKTTEKVHYILKEFYTNEPDGLIGNEDCGQMSAWYVLSTMGLYSVTPGSINWATTEPFLEEFKINYEDGTSEIIKKADYNPNQQKTFRNMPWTSQIGPHPLPLIDNIIPVPYFEFENNVFDDHLEVKIVSPVEVDGIFYTISNLESNSVTHSELIKYAKPIKISQNSIIEVFSRKGQIQSNKVKSTFHKFPNHYKIEILSQYNPQYTAGGDRGLLDGIYGTTNWRKGDWQGYQNQDFTAIIDLNKKTKISQISANFLQDTRSWIIFPIEVIFYASNDQKKWTILGKQSPEILAENMELNLWKASVDNQKKWRYIKVEAKNYGDLPQWHQGFGGKAFIFIDEISIQ